jgi:hypothetical protein
MRDLNKFKQKMRGDVREVETGKERQPVPGGER